MTFNNIINYFKENFDDMLSNAAEAYFEANRYNVKRKLYFKCHSDDLYCDETNVKAVHPYLKSDEKIEFDIIVTIKICGTERHGWDVDCIDKDLWLKINGEGTLKKEIKDFNIISICDYESISDKHKIPLNKNLIPYMSREKLDFIAQDFLKKFYPDGLKEAIYVNPRIIAKRLNLAICKHNISMDKSILGRIFFEDTISSFYDNEKACMKKIKVKAKTIVYDPDAYFMDNIEKENNNTIMHECVHYYFHKKAIELYTVLNNKFKYFDFKNEINFGNDALGIMEWQAHHLTPRILMPYETFRDEAYRLIKLFRIKNNCDTIDIISNVISSLSNTFHVSKQAVKIRLCDIGIKEAYGCNICCDGYQAPNFTYDDGSCAYNETFVIPFIDAVLLSLNSIVDEMMKSQKLLYLESHLCLNLEEFIGTDIHGNKFIKHEAKKHLNRFCIKMKIKLEDDNHLCEKELLLYRNKGSKIKTKLVFEEENNKLGENEKILTILNEEKKFSKAFFDLNNDFVSCMKMLKEKSKLTYEDIEEETTIQISSIKNIFSGKRDGTLLRLTVILMAMGAEPDVAYHVIDKSGVRIDMGNEEHLLCRFIINTMHADTMENILYYIKLAGFTI